MKEVEDKLRDALGIVEEGDENEEEGEVPSYDVEEKVVQGEPIVRQARGSDKGSSAGEKSEGSVGLPDEALHERRDGPIELGKVV